MMAGTALGNAGIGSWIERRARAASRGVALIAADLSLTYAEVADRGRRRRHRASVTARPRTSTGSARGRGARAQTTEQELLAWCREHLAAYQVPALVIFAGCLPRNSAGKLIRAEQHNAAALTPPAAAAAAERARR
jgi:acyl-CoA synthetase (AMP-forming)/AMP-acid ligase II